MEGAVEVWGGAPWFTSLVYIATELKLGNGTSLLIAVNILSALPLSAGQTLLQAQSEGNSAGLAAFALAMLFAAILAFTGLVSRRSADFALILAAAAFMANRLWSRRRFARARRAALDWTQRLKSAGELVVSVDDSGLSLVAGALRNVWTFADAQDVEDAGGLVYLWPRRGEPAVLPSRVFPDAAAIARFVSFARAHGAKGSQPSPVDDDD